MTLTEMYMLKLHLQRLADIVFQDEEGPVIFRVQPDFSNVTPVARVTGPAGRIEPRAVKRRPKSLVRLTMPRQVAREQIAKRGHGKEPGLN